MTSACWTGVLTTDQKPDCPLTAEKITASDYVWGKWALGGGQAA